MFVDLKNVHFKELSVLTNLQPFAKLNTYFLILLRLTKGYLWFSINLKLWYTMYRWKTNTRKSSRNCYFFMDCSLFMEVPGRGDFYPPNLRKSRNPPIFSKTLMPVRENIEISQTCYAMSILLIFNALNTTLSGHQDFWSRKFTTV